ncbi:MAG: hypothetical protein Q9160_005326 [Pyrenula sp. 1 TL-2023]
MTGILDPSNTTIEDSEEMVGIESSGLEPTQVLSTRKSLRKSLPPPRSASPKKTGINGSARRSGAAFTPSKTPAQDPEDVENTPIQSRDSPAQSNGLVRRFSPEKTPLRERHLANHSSPRTTRQSPQSAPNRKSLSSTPGGKLDAIVDDILDETENSVEHPNASDTIALAPTDIDESFDVNPMGDDEAGTIDPTLGGTDGLDLLEEDGPEYTLPNGPDDAISSVEDEDSNSEDVDARQDAEDDQTNGVPTPTKKLGRPPKRKSDALEAATMNTQSKKAKTGPSAKAKGKQPVYRDPSPVIPSVEQTPKPTQPVKSNSKSKRAPKSKYPNVASRLAPEREKELQDVVERIKSRPGPPRSLFILKRETPTDDSNARTRSGRVSVKPLAYWKNERCVFGEGSPHNVGIGERFPMSSIKEIVRVEEQENGGQPGKKGKKGKSKGKGRKPTEADVEASFDAADSEDEHAEPWETELGVYQGFVRGWDEEEQVPVDESAQTGRHYHAFCYLPSLRTNEWRTIDIAYAPASITCREVKNATFRYAKLLSLPFFGAGIVELPVGGTKKSKNSSRMHMCFFVLQGRVTATVAGNVFSVGKGGMWQVPRGNQYAIDNELGKDAKIFFSQGCIPKVRDEEE